MRRRARRELGIVILVALILVGVVFGNSQMRRGDLKDRMITWRKTVEAGRVSQGLELLQWPLLQKTTGNFRSGPTFAQDLAPKDGGRVNLIGFMVPLEQFRQMTEFLLLPMPIECYFCEQPPMRDVVLVQMAPGRATALYNEPTLINGTLELRQGERTKFFYIIRDAGLGPGEAGGALTTKEVPPEHRIGSHVQKMQDEPLLPPVDSTPGGAAPAPPQ